MQVAGKPGEDPHSVTCASVPAAHDEAGRQILIVFGVTRVHCFRCRPSDNDPGGNRECHEKAAVPIVMRYQDPRQEHGRLIMEPGASQKQEKRFLGAKAEEESHARATSGGQRALPGT